MRILKLYLIILLWLVVFLTAACRTGSLAINDIQGCWTRGKYIETVRRTRSPFAERPETVTIEGNKFYWANQHEGSWRKVVLFESSKTKGVYRLVLGEWEMESPGSRLIDVPFKPVLDRYGNVEAIAFLDDAVVENKQEPFVKISRPLELVVAQMVLVGAYEDEEGRKYSFDKSGAAHWPSVSFSYEVALDSFMASCDYFFVDYDKNPVNTKTYGFKWAGGKMELYNTKDEDWGLVCENRPFAILTPKMR